MNDVKLKEALQKQDEYWSMQTDGCSYLTQWVDSRKS